LFPLYQRNWQSAAIEITKGGKMEIRVAFTVKIDDDKAQGYADSDIESTFYGTSGFDRLVQRFVSDGTCGEIDASDVEVTVGH